MLKGTSKICVAAAGTLAFGFAATGFAGFSDSSKTQTLIVQPSQGNVMIVTIPTTAPQAPYALKGQTDTASSAVQLIRVGQGETFVARK